MSRDLYCLIGDEEKMYYDLNVPWTPTTKDADLQQKIAFLAECGFNYRDVLEIQC